MEHVHEERLIEYWVDGQPLTSPERTHLADCARCQQASDAIEELRDELAVARASLLHPETEAKLMAIFEEARRSTPPGTPTGHPLRGLGDHMTEWVRALPRWDSRMQASALGVRSGNHTGYRLLFGTDATEVELMVEPTPDALRVIGEVMVNETTAQSGLALIELMAHAGAKSALEAESDAHGHFVLEQVPPGTYVMTITPRYGEMLVIEPLELT